MDSGIALFISVCIGAIFLFIYLRKRTVNKYYDVLNEVKSIINGRWLNYNWVYGFRIEGEYQGHRVRCGIRDDDKGLAFIEAKLNKVAAKTIFVLDFPHPTPETNLINGWIVNRFPVFNWKGFFQRESFINELNKFIQICKELENGREAI